MDEASANDFALFEGHFLENFSTTLIAFSMRRSEEFARRVASHILDKAGFGRAITVDSVEREHPIHDSSRPAPLRIDLVVSGHAAEHRFVLAVEAKKDALFGPTQLTDYRRWLNNQDPPRKVLATLTRDNCRGTVEQPDVRLLWNDLLPLVRQMESEAGSAFEKPYWKHVSGHLEEIMRTFEGFSNGCDVHKLMQEVELFLQAVVRNLDVDRSKSDWQASRAAYYLYGFRGTIGFYWWRGDFWREAEPNPLCFWRDGDTDPTMLASFETVIQRAGSSVDPTSRDRYISEIAEQVRGLSATSQRV